MIGEFYAQHNSYTCKCLKILWNLWNFEKQTSIQIIQLDDVPSGQYGETKTESFYVVMCALLLVFGSGMEPRSKLNYVTYEGTHYQIYAEQELHA